MTKLGAALLLGLLFAAVPAYADGSAPTRVAQREDDDEDEDAADRADSDRADEDDDRPARRSRWRRAADDDDDGGRDDDDTAGDDEDDDRPARRPARRKRPAPRDDDDAGAADADERADADADDEEDRPRRRRPARRPVTRDADEADADEDDGRDADDRADADADDERPRRRARRRPRPERDGDEAAEDDAAASDTVEAGSVRVVEEIYVIPPKLTLAAELLGAAPIDGVNSDLFSMGGGVGLGVEYYLSPVLALHASASFLYFRAGDAMDTTSWASGQLGPRVHLGGKLFGAHTPHDAWLDAHVSYGSSGGIRRPGFDVGGAVQWELSNALRVGPMVRWAFGSDPLDKNAQLLTIGLAVGVGGRSRQTLHIEGDADGDGLVDKLDACPTELPGDSPDPDRAGCPTSDEDGDGILDDEDECTDEPAGDRPDLDRIGCPLPPIKDRDGDTVIDSDDRCPDQPGAVREGGPNHGCPLARVQDHKIEILEQIFFENDSVTISESSRPVLEAIGKVVGELGTARISIEGHTSETGTDGYNMDLSKRRARAVAQWLIENAGVAATRLDVKGWGKRRPLVSGPGSDTSKNRRVEFLILEGT